MERAMEETPTIREEDQQPNRSERKKNGSNSNPKPDEQKSEDEDSSNEKDSNKERAQKRQKIIEGEEDVDDDYEPPADKPEPTEEQDTKVDMRDLEGQTGTERQKILKLQKAEKEKKKMEEDEEDEDLSDSDKKEEVDLGPVETEEEAISVLKSSSDFAMVLYYLDVFKSALNISSVEAIPKVTKGREKNKPKKGKRDFDLFYSAEKLEKALAKCRSPTTAPEIDKEFLIKLHIKFLNAIIQNRKPPTSSENWERVLKNFINRQLNAVTSNGESTYKNNAVFDNNPFDQENYFRMPVSMKLKLLRALCDWTLDYSPKVADLLKEVDPNNYTGSLREEPFGTDSKGYRYWTFDTNDETPRLYRDKAPTWKNKELIPEPWETVSTTIPELQAFSETLSTSRNKDEKELKERIDDDLLEALLESERKKESALKKLARMEVYGLRSSNVITGERRSRAAKKEVNYAYDFDDLVE